MKFKNLKLSIDVSKEQGNMIFTINFVIKSTGDRAGLFKDKSYKMGENQRLFIQDRAAVKIQTFKIIKKRYVSEKTQSVQGRTHRK
jgi:hypothetical protein